MRSAGIGISNRVTFPMRNSNQLRARGALDELTVGVDLLAHCGSGGWRWPMRWFIMILAVGLPLAVYRPGGDHQQLVDVLVHEPSDAGGHFGVGGALPIPSGNYSWQRGLREPRVQGLPLSVGG